MNKKILHFIIIVLFVSGFIFLKPDNFTQANPEVTQQINQQQQNVQKDSLQDNGKTVVPASIPQKNLNQLKNIAKDTHKNNLLKFFLAMIGVIFSAAFIYGGLLLYKKISKNNNAFISNPNDQRSLESPKDFKTAINIFLNKTDI